MSMCKICHGIIEPVGACECGYRQQIAILKEEIEKLKAALAQAQPK